MCDLEVECIGCHKKWIKHGGDSIEWPNNNDPSGSLCDECFAQKIVPLIRRKQKQEGNFDCFGRATQHYCDQSLCKYKNHCLNISSIPITTHILAQP